MRTTKRNRVHRRSRPASDCSRKRLRSLRSGLALAETGCTPFAKVKLADSVEAVLREYPMGAGGPHGR